MKSYIATGIVLLSSLVMGSQKAPIMEIDEENDIIITPEPVYRGVKAHPATEEQKNDPEQIAIVQEVTSSDDFKDLPEEIQKLIIDNQGNYKKYKASGVGYYSILFENDEFRILGGIGGGVPVTFALLRKSFNRPEDILFVYEKEEAQKWVKLESSDIKIAQKKDKLSDDDIAYLKALLEITNENIQYLYGAKFKARNVANMNPREDNTSEHDQFKENLIGRYIPFKMLTFCAFDTQLDEKSTEDLFEKPHMLALSTQLGRPVYDMRNYYDESHPVYTLSRCSTGGDATLKTYDGFPWSVTYYTSLPFDEMHRSYKISTSQLETVDGYLQGFSVNLIEEMEKKGVDLTNPKNNKTALRKALYMFAAKTLDLTHQIYLSPVHKKFATHATGIGFGEAKSLADMIPVKKSSLTQKIKKLPAIVAEFKAMEPWLKPKYLADSRKKPFIYEENKKRHASAGASAGVNK